MAAAADPRLLTNFFENSAELMEKDRKKVIEYYNTHREYSPMKWGVSKWGVSDQFNAKMVEDLMAKPCKLPGEGPVSLSVCKIITDAGKFGDRGDKKLVVLENCNARAKAKAWPRCLNNPEQAKRIGCGVNAFVFLETLSRELGEREQNKLDQKDVAQQARRQLRDASPFSEIIWWFNNKFPSDDGQKVNVMEGTWSFGSSFYRHTGDKILAMERFANFYKFLLAYMPINSCILVRFNRPEGAAVKLNLTSGHWVVISKERKGENYTLVTYEPAVGGRKEMNRRTGPTKNFYEAMIDTQKYESASFMIVGRETDAVHLGGYIQKKYNKKKKRSTRKKRKYRRRNTCKCKKKKKKI